MKFCNDCRHKKNWPNSAVMLSDKCEVCGKPDACYEVPSVKLVPESSRTVEQKLVYKIMQDGFREKAEQLVVTTLSGKVDHVLTEELRKIQVARSGEIDWFDTYQLRFVAQQAIQKDEESKRNKRPL